MPKLNAPRLGWVYVMTNPAMPGLVKIGCTGRTPEERAAELSRSTGVPARYVVAWAWPVTDWQQVERLCHTRLEKLRPNRDREFFACSVKQAARGVRGAARAWMRPAWLRLLIGPRRQPAAYPGGPGWHRRPARGSGLPAVSGVALAVLLVGLLAHYKPALPSWVPDGSARRAVQWVEVHGR
jgi:hypothetical protein